MSLIEESSDRKGQVHRGRPLIDDPIKVDKGLSVVTLEILVKNTFYPIYPSYVDGGQWRK